MTATVHAPAAAARGARVPFAVVAALLLLVLAVAASLALGSRPVPPATVLDALLQPVAGNADHSVVRDQRLPRTMTGVLVGAALGLAGALMQGLTRNPVADPGLLGVNAGASLGVLLAVSWWGVPASGAVWFALAGAALATAAVAAIGSLGVEAATPARLVIAGAATTALATSLITVVLLTDPEALERYRFWQLGSLQGRPLAVVSPLWPFLLVGVTVAVFAGRTLDLLALGDDAARGLGLHVGRARWVLLGVVVVLCGAATAAAGPLLFVGLAVPHLARALVGPRYGPLLAVSALAGPALLLAADVLGRLVAAPAELDVGVVVAFLGAPLLIALIRRRSVML